MSLLEELRDLSYDQESSGAMKIFKMVFEKHKMKISEIVEVMKENAKYAKHSISCNFEELQDMIDVEYYFSHLHFKTSHLFDRDSKTNILEISWRY